MSSRREIRTRYIWLCESVAKIFADVDVVGITEGNPDPVGEYSREAADTVRRIIKIEEDGGIIDTNAVETILREIFHREFEIDLASDHARDLSDRIIYLIQAFPPA